MLSFYTKMRITYFFYSLPLCVQIYLIFYWFSPYTLILYTSYVEGGCPKNILTHIYFYNLLIMLVSTLSYATALHYDHRFLFCLLVFLHFYLQLDCYVLLFLCDIFVCHFIFSYIIMFSFSFFFNLLFSSSTNCT